MPSCSLLFPSKLISRRKKNNKKMSAQQIILILGAGPRIGAAVAASFAHKGYKIAIASRKGTNTKTIEQYLSLEADFADPSTIPALFNLTKEEFGSYPNVVVYNAPAMTPPPNKDSVLSISQDSVRSDLNVNTISPYVAAQEAVKAWETTLDGRKKSFIYTGNMLNKAIVPMPALLNLGIGKSASAFWIGVADASYKEKNYR